MKQVLKVTQQWVKDDVFEAMVECAKCRPDFEVNVSALQKDDHVYLARIVFNNCGKTVFTSRLLNFAIVSMRDHYRRPDSVSNSGNISALPVTSHSVED
jgi:hypothetical protein